MAKKVTYDAVVPGRASRLAPLLEERRGILVRLWLWIALAAFGVVISILTLVVSKGAVMAVWWGPVAFGVYKAIKTRPELREIDRHIALTP